MLQTGSNEGAMEYLFAAYTAIWIVLAVYLYSIHSREKKLREDIRQLRRLIESRDDSSGH